ncbi:MAG: hypothetical protein SGJ11_00240, partial [Phycisphaerae bacterium]|nr:hypothetical protein [Phycisphaerae bacterium]
MLTYLVRRILVMIPTLLGITFLVFSLLALAPGGIGAGLTVSGGNMDASKLAQLQARLEDRYGLNDPLLVQYGRWLSHLSPLKFGKRDQVSPGGELISSPAALHQPPLQHWFPFEPAVVGVIPTRPLVDETTRSDAQRDFRRLQTQYATARGAYNGTRKQLSLELIDYAKAEGIGGARTPKGEVRWSAFARIEPDRANLLWPSIERMFADLHRQYDVGEAARARMANAFDAKPFEEAGIGIVPDVLTIGPPDLGVSFSSGRPVSELILSRLPVTLLLNFIAFPIIYLVAIPSGMLAASRKGSLFDVTSGAMFLALWSIPTVWAGVLAIGYLASPQGLNAFPVTGLHDTAADTWPFLPTWSSSG